MGNNIGIPLITFDEGLSPSMCFLQVVVSFGALIRIDMTRQNDRLAKTSCHQVDAKESRGRAQK